MKVPSPVFSDPASFAIFDTLLHDGVAAEDAEAWAEGWTSAPDPRRVVVVAGAFKEHGVPVREALDWHQRGFEPGEALYLHDAGYSPEHGEALLRLARDAEVAAWLGTGLPASRVVTYLRAKVGLAEVAQFEQFPDVETLLATLGALMDPPSVRVWGVDGGRALPTWVAPTARSER